MTMRFSTKGFYNQLIYNRALLQFKPKATIDTNDQ